MIDSRERISDGVWFAVASGTILLFAVVLRFRGLDVSLFEDEVWVAELIRRGNWHPHSYLTPPLFYLLERGWAALRGTSPARLRELPALFGVLLAAVPLFANRDRLTRLVWSLLLACSSPLLFYSGRLKQYTLEACVTALLVVLLLRALQSNQLRTWVAFFALALLGVATLYSTVFVVGAAALAVAFRAPRRLPGFALVLGVWAIAYFGYLSPGPESTALHGDMTVWFTQTGRWVTSPAALLRNTLHFGGQMMNLVRGWWIVALFTAIYALLRTDDIPLSVVAAAPVAAVAAASVWHFYPYGEVRLLIFAFPALYLLVASMLTALAMRVTRFASIIVVLLLFAFVWNGIARDTYNATYMRVADLRPLFDYVATNHHGGERVFAVSSLEAPLRFHHPELTVERWNDGRVGTAGWYLALTPPAKGTAGVLHLADAWAWRVSAPSAAGSAPAPGSP